MSKVAEVSACEYNHVNSMLKESANSVSEKKTHAYTHTFCKRREDKCREEEKNNANQLIEQPLFRVKHIREICILKFQREHQCLLLEYLAFVCVCICILLLMRWHFIHIQYGTTTTTTAYIRITLNRINISESRSNGRLLTLSSSLFLCHTSSLSIPIPIVAA